MTGEASPRRAVFWDRDGTLMREVDYCGHPSRVEAIPGAGEALRELSACGWLQVVITNQSGIGRGYFSEEDFHAVNAELARQIGVTPDAIYFCPDAPPAPSDRRKPSPAMVLEACRDLGIDPALSWFVGDKDVDIACGQAAGCRTILVLTGYGCEQSPKCNPDFIEPDAPAAARRILSNGERNSFWPAVKNHPCEHPHP